MVHCSDEKLGLGPTGGSMQDLSSLIDDLELINLPMQGGSFTWFGGHVLSRLDRFLIFGDWEEYERSIFDHWPMLLDSGGIQSGSVPFRSENMWFQSAGFVDTIRS